MAPPEGHEFVAASKRDASSFFALAKLIDSKAEFFYLVYGLGGQIQAQVRVAREILQAQAIEGTPVIACSHILRQQTGFTGKPGKSDQVLTFSFDILMPTVNQGAVFKGIRLAKSHSDATDFIQTVYFNCIRVTEAKATICARKPCTTENSFAQLALETEISKDQAALLLSCVHLCSGKTQLVYRDYVFKVRSGRSYEVMCEITKQMTFSAAGTPVSRLIGFSCGAAYTSLLYNSFGAVTAYGDLLIYQFNKQQPVQKVRLQQQAAFVTLCNFNNSLLCVADGEQVTFYGVGGQFNDFPALQKLYQQLCAELAPAIAHVSGGSDESARYLCQMNLIPQAVFQQLNLDQGSKILDPLTRITLPFSVSQVSADARNLIISGRGRTLLFSLDQLRNQFKYDALVKKCGDFLANFCGQCSVDPNEALQLLQQKGVLSNQPIQDALIDPDNASEGTTMAMTTQTPLTATNQLRASSPVHNIADILAENHFDELSALRNSQADVPANMTGTRGLIELGNLVAAQDWGSGHANQDAAQSANVQATSVQNSQLLSRGGVSMSQYAAGVRSAANQQSELQSQALEAARQANESMSQQLATRESQLKRSQELLSQLFGSLAQSDVQTLDLQHLGTAADAQAFLGGVAGIFRGNAERGRQVEGLLGALDKCLGPELSYAIARSCAFRPAQGVSPSAEALDQQFYHGNQVYKLFQVVFESSYLLPCGHVLKRASSRIVLDLEGHEGESRSGSRSGSPATSGSGGAGRGALQGRLMSLFRGEFAGAAADEVLTCRQCRQQASADGAHEELYNVALPMKLLVLGDAPLLQRLHFELNGVEHAYVLQAVLDEQLRHVFALDEHGDWYDALAGAPAAFPAVQQRFAGTRCFSVYTKPALNDVRLSQETFRAIVDAFGSTDFIRSRSGDQLSHEFSQLQRHDAESQKIIQNQNQTIQKLQLQLKDIQRSLREESISDLSLADLIKQNSAFRAENEELKTQNAEQEKQITVLVAENEQLQQQLSTKMTNREAETVVRQCLELMGARNIPRYGEELYRQLHNQCMAVQAERKILRSGDIAVSGPGSLINSNGIVSSYAGNKCYECLLPALAVIFALVLVGLFALVLMDSL